MKYYCANKNIIISKKYFFACEGCSKNISKINNHHCKTLTIMRSVEIQYFNESMIELVKYYLRTQKLKRILE